MLNLVIVSLKDEAQAAAASQKLVELEFLGDITVYDKVIVKKTPDGKSELLKAETTEGLRTLSGAALGTLVGTLAGPVGMAVGMFAGTMGGAAMEADYFSFSEDFGSKITNQMKPGTVALIAEIDEDNIVFVDGTLTPLGAKITRTEVDYAYDQYIDEQIEELEEDIASERLRLKLAAADEKEKIQARIAKLKEKRAQRISDLQKKAKEALDSGKSKIESLRAQAMGSLTEMKIARLKNKIEKHQQKLAELEEELKHVES